jgi:hypothetical protein
MERGHKRRRWRWALAAAAVAVAACDAKGGRTNYSNSPDSGAVPPAMRIDTSLTRTMPDSTAGGPGRTGKPGVAGDTLSTRGRPVGTGVVPRDTTKRRP